MRSILLLRHMKVENANAIAGLTWGFPAMSAFLGFTHALSRIVEARHKTTLGGCGVVCHHHEVKAHQPSAYGEYLFSLNRIPLTKESNTAPFNEEGKMHLEVSLIIECDIRVRRLSYELDSHDEKQAAFENEVLEQVLMQRLAGGVIQSVQSVELLQVPELREDQDRFLRRQMLKLLPGYAVVDRSELLHAHWQYLQEREPDVDLLDAWLDFSALRYSADTNEADSAEKRPKEGAVWNRVTKPAEGWFVPIMTGYRAISPVYQPGEVAHARDETVPFGFVESVYGVGQWLSPHRIRDFQEVFWRYRHDNDLYLCSNNISNLD